LQREGIDWEASVREGYINLKRDVRQIPAGTETAILQCMVVLDNELNPVPTRIVELVHVNVYKNMTGAPDPQTNIGCGMICRQYVVRRRLLFDGTRQGGMERQPDDAPMYRVLLGANRDWGSYGRQRSVVQTCLGCHITEKDRDRLSVGVFSLNSIFCFVTERGMPGIVIPMGSGTIKAYSRAERTVAGKPAKKTTCGWWSMRAPGRRAMLPGNKPGDTVSRSDCPRCSRVLRVSLFVLQRSVARGYYRRMKLHFLLRVIMSALLATTCVVVFAAEGKAAPKTRAKRAPNPAMAKIEDAPGLPRVLLIGDSISIGYTLPVRDLLKGKANVHRIPTNGGPTINGLKNLKQWLGDSKWDVIHFNWGLHDLKYMGPNNENRADPKGSGAHVQVPLADYEKNLRELVGQMKVMGARLIWCSTTPVLEGSPGRVAGSELKYNEAAARVMKDAGITTNDLWAHAKPKIKEIQLPDGNVHFTTEGSKYLAEKVAAAIEAAMSKK
jgi:acyl-CoA thioesterase-1